MSDQVETLRNVVTAAMAGGVHSEDELRTTIAMFRGMTMFAAVSDEDAELLFKQLTQSLLIELDLGVAVTSSDFEPWLEGTQGLHRLAALEDLQAVAAAGWASPPSRGAPRRAY